MRSQTGGTILMGWGSLHAKSSKQKLNTKSSTESDLVGMSDYLPYNIWWIHFLNEQGYKVKDKKNGRNSCTGNSCHIDIRYFFIKDRIDKGEVRVKYCGTDIMLADYFTKPLQGSLFHKFRNVIMGYHHISYLHNHHNIGNKECVEQSTNSISKNCETRF